MRRARAYLVHERVLQVHGALRLPHARGVGGDHAVVVPGVLHAVVHLEVLVVVGGVRPDPDARVHDEPLHLHEVLPPVPERLRPVVLDALKEGAVLREAAARRRVAAEHAGTQRALPEGGAVPHRVLEEVLLQALLVLVLHVPVEQVVAVQLHVLLEELGAVRLELLEHVVEVREGAVARRVGEAVLRTQLVHGAVEAVGRLLVHRPNLGLKGATAAHGVGQLLVLVVLEPADGLAVRHAAAVQVPGIRDVGRARGEEHGQRVRVLHDLLLVREEHLAHDGVVAVAGDGGQRQRGGGRVGVGSAGRVRQVLDAGAQVPSVRLRRANRRPRAGLARGVEVAQPAAAADAAAPRQHVAVPIALGRDGGRLLRRALALELRAAQPAPRAAHHVDEPREQREVALEAAARHERLGVLVPLAPRAAQQPLRVRLRRRQAQLLVPVLEQPVEALVDHRRHLRHARRHERRVAAEVLCQRGRRGGVREQPRVHVRRRHELERPPEVLLGHQRHLLRVRLREEHLRLRAARSTPQGEAPKKNTRRASHHRGVDYSGSFFVTRDD